MKSAAHVALMAGLLLLLTGCGKAAAPLKTAEQYMAEAKKVDTPVTAAQDLFATNAPVEKWNEVFTADPGDLSNYEAFAYRQLLRGQGDTVVGEALTHAATLNKTDGWVNFLIVRRELLGLLHTKDDEEAARKTASDRIVESLAFCKEADGDNAFYDYQEAAFCGATGDLGGALRALQAGNSAPQFQHPFGPPFPRDLTDLDSLVGAMGPSFGVFFQTTPRTFMPEVHAQLRALATQYAKDPKLMAVILRAGQRQLSMTPFDLPSFSAALAFNKALWQGYGQAPEHAAARDAVLEALAAFEKPFAEQASATEILSKRLRNAEDAQLAYGAAMLAATKQAEHDLAPLRKDLDEVITANLPPLEDGETKS
ncbi:MAG: hypothetical protein ABI743_06885 [bacterium]